MVEVVAKASMESLVDLFAAMWSIAVIRGV